MPSFITPNAVWPEPGWLLLRLIVAFALSIALAWLVGRDLVDAILPLARTILLWIDERFAILFLGLDHSGQDTVIRLRVSVARMIVIGRQVIEPHPKGWLEVTTPAGAMLQPLSIALGLAAAWPGQAVTVLRRVGVAMALGLSFMVLDIPLTLHAYTWEMFVERFDPDRFSLLMLIHRLLHDGGRLGVGVLLAVLAACAVARGGNKGRSGLSESASEL